LTPAQVQNCLTEPVLTPSWKIALVMIDRSLKAMGY